MMPTHLPTLLSIKTAIITLFTIAMIAGSAKPAAAQASFSSENLLHQTHSSGLVLTGMLNQWPGALTLLEDLDLIESPEQESDPWREPRWVMPKRTEWTFVDGYPIVGTPRVDELYHTITRYRDARWVRQRYKLSIEALGALNPDIDLAALEEGDEILVWRHDPSHVSEGRGAPNRGRLSYAEPLPLADKYHILHRHRAFGTYYAVSEIKRVFDGYAEAFPDAEPVIIGDLSFRTGRRIRPHLSHQTGRDVDITYPRFSLPPNFNRFHYISRRDLDAQRTLWLVREFIASGMIEYIFMDRWVQRLVYKEAQRQGAPQEWLDEVFEYPGWGGKAMVRRAKGHDDHMHIRFWCQKQTDRWCQ